MRSGRKQRRHLHLLLVVPAIANAAANLRQLQPRIVGGDVADATRYPYFSLLRLFVGNDVYRCGGSLIATDVILTAAHCYGVGKVTQVEVWVNYTSDVGLTGYEQLRRAVEIIPHEDFHGEFDNDVMVIKLDRPVKGVPIVQFNNDSAVPIDGQQLTVCGLGRTDFSNKESRASNLMVVDVNVVPIDDCNDRNSYNGRVKSQAMFCAAAFGKDACFGDSGGPLIARGRNPESDVLLGIVSWGNGCGIANFPGIYSRVSTYNAWIQDKLCRFSRHRLASCPPTLSRSSHPSVTKSTQPSNLPSLAPSRLPSHKPSDASTVPSASPSGSSIPSASPSHDPSHGPSYSESPTQSERPTNSPSTSDMPSQYPTTTVLPSSIPSNKPSVSSSPSNFPSVVPSIELVLSTKPPKRPTKRPTNPHPSYKPSQQPSRFRFATKAPRESAMHSVYSATYSLPSIGLSERPSVSIFATKSPKGTTERPTYPPTSSPKNRVSTSSTDIPVPIDNLWSTISGQNLPTNPSTIVEKVSTSPAVANLVTEPSAQPPKEPTAPVPSNFWDFMFFG